MIDDQLRLLRAVSAYDPALDRARMPMDLYYETRDEALVMEQPGMTARRFVLAPLSSSECAMCDSLTSEPAKLMQAFRLACVAIESFAVAGIALEPTGRIGRPDGTERTVWRDSEIDRVSDELGLEVIYEMGVLALERRRLGKWGRGAVRYTPPLFLALELDRIRRLRAEHTATTNGTRSSVQYAPATAATTPATSDEATAAPAASGAASPAESG
jgi:hypothetical protein